MNANPNDVATNDSATLTEWRELRGSSLATMPLRSARSIDSACVPRPDGDEPIRSIPRDQAFARSLPLRG